GRCRGSSRGRGKRSHDRLELVSRAPTEERERDVELLAREHADAVDARERLLLPAPQRVDGVFREAQGAKKSQAITTLDASREVHAEPSRLCDRSRRTSWSAAIVARARTVSRSAGTLNSPPRAPSGPTAWK